MRPEAKLKYSFLFLYAMRSVCLVCKKQFETNTGEFICSECKQKSLKECKICKALTPEVDMTHGICNQCKHNLDFGYRFEPTMKIWMNRRKAELMGFNFDKDLIGLDNITEQ
jgi:predicted amidophosphoribosyltransferase